ncbi:hypothetical protein J2X73_002692 [Novosphingobium sp. 1748]|uniref:DUF6118 family protein n=1 Tax=Novosphingobium sp. 1748 TaxID=2817760 RepID=UPI0028546E5B|nr:DUF6118 family protein [Novosphingobium sp. 1748]MDR6708321.1 hypothetical protein [Novosphingobium sp. 1748]
MDNEQNLLNVPEPETETNAAAEAFAGLAASVAGMETRMERRMDMLTRAVEHVAIEKQSIEIPDYTPTLAKMNGVLADMTKRMKAVEEAPALQMTPENLAARMQAAATKARQDDQATILQAKQTHSDAAHALWELHGRVLTIQEQRRRLMAVAGGGVFAGCLLWSFLPGVVVRALPTDWHLPERLAARTVGGASVWDAGSQMMQADNPSGWQVIVDAAEMRRQNRDTINTCEKAAAKAKEAVRCTIRIEKSRS